MAFRKNHEEEEKKERERHNSLKEKFVEGAKRAWSGSKEGAKKAYSTGIKAYEGYGKAVKGTRKGVRMAQLAMNKAHDDIYRINKQYGIGPDRRLKGIVYNYPARHKKSNIHMPTQSYKWGL